MHDYDRIRKIVESKRIYLRLQHRFRRHLAESQLLLILHMVSGASEGGVSGMKSDFTSFSFHAVKNLTTAEGGALTWRSIPRLMMRISIRCFTHSRTVKDALAKD